MFKNLVGLITCLVLTGVAYGQGTIRGTVVDADDQEVIPYTIVGLKNRSEKTRTDFEGEFEFKVPAGTYTLVASNSKSGYMDEVELEVTVVDGDVSVVKIELRTAESIKKLGPVIVKASKGGGSVSREQDDERRQNEAGATEGVTKEQMQEQGATNVVDAIQTAPGLSIEDGKSVYIRGLGDRYTKTILNGMEIPGLDPDRNSVQMDIFPAAVVDNITVYKTFVPNLTGDFTGGLVDITTKDLPSERTIYAKASLGYNSMATFNSNFLSYEGGALDFLGIDDGSRELPVRVTDKFPHPSQDDPQQSILTNRFSKVMSAQQSMSFLNQTYAFAYGNRKVFKLKDSSNLDYGYNAVINYRAWNNFYEDVQYSEFRLESTNGTPLNELEKSRVSQGMLAESNVLWTALVGQSLKFNLTKLKLTLFHTQNGQSSAASLLEEDFEDNPGTLEKTSLQYTQRSVSNLNLHGFHYLDTAGAGKWTLDWKVSPTYSLIKDPDIRSTALAYYLDSAGAPVYGFDASLGAQTRRIWRSLNEINLGGRFDLAYTHEMESGRKTEVKFGGLNTYKTRSFSIQQYIFDYYPPSATVEFSGDPDWYFQEENIWSPETGEGLYTTGAFEPANQYDARQNVSGAYVMNEFPITNDFRATYGLRVEHAQNWYSGQNNLGTEIFEDTLILDEYSFLPSVNLVYKIEKPADSSHYKRYTNLRGAYTKTVARPSLKEKSLAQIYDPIQGRTFNGNIDLIQTDIHNFDARWEYFFGRTELLSASAFYKQFLNPIELVAFSTDPDNTQPLNTGTAQVYGAEVEIRKAVGFSKKGKEHLGLLVGANYTYVVSKVDMRESMMMVGPDSLISEKELRESYARAGETIGNFRPMYGQSPYIINAFATFRNDSLGLICNVSYNVQGKKLAVIGTGRIPDVYEQPFHSLNFKVSKTFGIDNEWQASLTGKNLLLSTRRKLYESYNATSQIYSYFNPGMTISASISYNLSGKRTKKAPVETGN